MTDSTTGSIAQEAKNLEMVNLKYYQHQAQTIRYYFVSHDYDKEEE